MPIDQCKLLEVFWDGPDVAVALAECLRTGVRCRVSIPHVGRRPTHSSLSLSGPPLGYTTVHHHHLLPFPMFAQYLKVTRALASPGVPCLAIIVLGEEIVWNTLHWGLLLLLLPALCSTSATATGPKAGPRSGICVHISLFHCPPALTYWPEKCVLARQRFSLILPVGTAVNAIGVAVSTSWSSFFLDCDVAPKKKKDPTSCGLKCQFSGDC